MSRRQRRRERRAESGGGLARSTAAIADQRPWYFRHGYHVGVWSGAALGVAWFAIFRDLIGLIAGIVLGQVAGLVLNWQGRR